jgi:hypothetical protein
MNFMRMVHDAALGYSWKSTCVSCSHVSSTWARRHGLELVNLTVRRRLAMVQSLFVAFHDKCKVRFDGKPNVLDS